MDTDVVIHGHAEDGFGTVADAFRTNFAERGEVGAGCSLYLDGSCVVDLWGGIADAPSGRPWDDSTLQLVFSTTKGVAAICLAQLVEAGKLAYTDRVAEHWPEFASNGKDAITIEQLVSHQGGLFSVDDVPTFDEVMAVRPIVDALAAQAPLSHPDHRHAYHALTLGWLIGELIARADGRSIGTYVAEEIAAPLGVECYIGLPETEHGRVSTIELAPPPTDPAQIEFLRTLYRRGGNGFRAITLDGVIRMAPANHFNTPAIYATEMAGANGISTAAALAKIYAATIGDVDGVRLISHDTMQLARTERVDGPDGTLIVPSRFGAGFWLHNASSPMIQDGSFGHPGAGGSVSFANPELGIGFSYVMNQMGNGLVSDPRAQALTNAVQSCL